MARQLRVSGEGMKLLVLLVRLVAMALVIVSCLAWVKRMAFVQGLTGSSYPLIVVALLSAVIFSWAYAVIWEPLDVRGRDT